MFVHIDLTNLTADFGVFYKSELLWRQTSLFSETLQTCVITGEKPEKHEGDAKLFI